MKVGISLPAIFVVMINTCRSILLKFFCTQWSILLDDEFIEGHVPHDMVKHSLIHYVALIHAFGAPNGLCLPITESKHIKAVKEPWCRSSHYKTLGQMLLTNQRMDKLAASHVDFTKCGMLRGTCLESSLVCLSMCPNICL